MTDQQKIDDAIVACILDSWHTPYCEDVPVGFVFQNVNLRFGTEGPDSWSRLSEVRVEQRHLDEAQRIFASEQRNR